MRCLHEIFEAQADARPSDLALIHRGGTLRYADLEFRANRLARYLGSLGARPGVLVAVWLERSAESIIAVLAALKAGAAYIPIDPSYPEERIRHILTEAGARILITDSALAARAAAAYAGPVVSVDAEEHLAEIARFPTDRIPRAESGVSPSDLCYVIYTSGTTGRPKGIMTEHRNVVEFLVSFNEVCGLDRSDRVYQGFSLSFDGSVEEIWMAFSNGAALVVGPPDLARIGDETGRYMASHGVTYFSTVPTFLSMITEDVPSLRLIVVSGEPCPPELVRRWVRPGRRMLNVYGPTETTVNATAWDCVPGVPVSIGRPLRGYEARILDEEMAPVPRGAPGELYIGGVGVSRGYLGQPELTRERFVTGPSRAVTEPPRLYRTGDLVLETDAGELSFLGRLDGQVKVRGYRIELAEIESLLREHTAVRAAAVKIVEQGGLNELAGYVVLADGAPGSFDRDELLDLLRKRLPAYMIPAYLDSIDSLPLLPSGKVDRMGLPEPRTPLVRSEREIVAPRTERERRIAAVWERVLRISPVSVEDDLFLDLGAYSLLAAQFVTLLRSEEGIEVSLREVYEHTSVAALARHIDSRDLERSPGDDRDRETAARPTSREVFESVPRGHRLSCVALQAVSVVVLYGLATAPLLAFTLVFLSIVRGDLAVASGVAVLLGLALVSYPLWVLLTVGLKWLVIGRHRPGTHRLWGLHYFRFWLAARLQAMSGAGLLSGTPIMSLYYRLMGAKVGRGCIIDTPLCVAYDLVTIGDDTCIGSETQLLGYRVEDGFLRVGHVEIGRRCFIGIHSTLGLDVRMEDDARLGDLSLLPDGGVIEEGRHFRGSPSRPGDVPVPTPRQATSERRRPFLFGLLHLLAFELLELMLLATVLPALAIVVPAYVLGGVWWGTASVLAAVPVGVVSFCLFVAGFKALILHRVEPGTYQVESWFFLRKWLVDALVAVSRVYMHALYTTIYLPPWLRTLGARIGRLAEISTVSQVSPDLIDIADGSFFADGSIVGGRHFFRGSVQVARNRIGRRSFVGNSAILPLGRHLGEGCLLGVLSTPPDQYESTPDGTEWLGSPSFRLPFRKKVEGFDDSVTYAPTPKLYAQRLAIDAVRILVPGVIAAVAALAFVGILSAVWSHSPLWALCVITAFVALGVSVAGALCVVILKWVIMGRFEPVIKPLWSTYVWWNEVINGAYETFAAPALAPLLGTPFFNCYLRLLGARVGRHAYVATTLFSEFDLVRIGDYAALNTGVVVQNHLFEDRIMKSSYLTIGDGCSVGNMAVILYDTEMEPGSLVAPLSLLMKGEKIPAGSRWIGIPTSRLT